MSNYGTGAKVRGWTPIFDHMVKQFSLMTSLVYGIVWRHCQMKDGVCKTGQSNMSKTLGVSVSTVHRGLELLEEKGYIECVSMTSGKTKHYITTNKADLEVVVEVRQADIEPLSGGQETPVTVTDKDTIKDTIEDIKELRKPNKVWDVAANLGVLTGMDIKLKTNKGRLLRSAKQLIEADYSAADILKFREWWYKDFWIGKRGQAPTLAQVIQLIASSKQAGLEYVKTPPTFDGALQYVEIQEEI